MNINNIILESAEEIVYLSLRYIRGNNGEMFGETLGMVLYCSVHIILASF